MELCAMYGLLMSRRVQYDFGDDDLELFIRMESLLPKYMCHLGKVALYGASACPECAIAVHNLFQILTWMCSSVSRVGATSVSGMFPCFEIVAPAPMLVHSRNV